MRWYQAKVVITKFRSGQQTAINDSLTDFDEFDEISEIDGALYTEATVCLMGISRETYVRELTQYVWNANQAFCKVSVGMLCLEDIPEFSLDEKDYDKWIKAKQEQTA